VISMEQQCRSANAPRAGRGSKFLAQPMRGLPRMFLVSGLVLVLALIPGHAAAQGESAGEYELKAAMLYKLTLFVDWPPSAYPDPQSPRIVCILGRDPFGDSLTSIVSTKTINGRPIEIRHPQGSEGVRGCHVLYISSSERKNIVQIFSTLKGYSVLTVAEMTQFAAHGGMIQFSLEEKQVHFDINLDAASRANVKISSRLLVLARIVKDQSNHSGREGGALSPRGFEIANSPPRTSSSKLQ
jgi:hypothetical protein